MCNCNLGFFVKQFILFVALLVATGIGFGQESFATPHDLDGDGKTDFTVARNLGGTTSCDAVGAAPWSGCWSDAVVNHIAWFSFFSGSQSSSIRSMAVTRLDGEKGYIFDPSTTISSPGAYRLLKLSSHENLFLNFTISPLNTEDSFSTFYLTSEYSGSSLADVQSWLTNQDLAGIARAAGAEEHYAYGVLGLFANLDGRGDSYLVLWAVDKGMIFTPNVGVPRVSNLSSLFFPHGLPVIADFDGDQLDELAVWVYETGEWIIREYGSLNEQRIQWGLAGDHPMPGDYDGDGKADLAVWRPSNGNWYILTSRSGYDKAQAQVYQFGLPHQGPGFDILGDIPVKGDYDGDGRLELAVYRPRQGSWFYRRSSDGRVVTVSWGLAGDVPVGMGVRDRVVRLPHWTNQG